jgi:N-acetylmuramoyl-L-alanine amidase
MAEDIDNTQQTAAPSGSAGGTSGGQSQSGGPAGTGNYEVQQGDCIESIAQEFGFFWQTLWNHGNNADLKRKRQDPNVLFEGDVVYVPDKTMKEESGATEQRHRFKRKGVPSEINIVLKDEKDRARANLPYTLDIDGQLFSGQTDSHGRIHHPIPPNSKGGKLIVGTAENKEEYELQLGYVDPVSEISGIQARLNNLGFDCGVIDGKLGPQTKDAIRDFQANYKLTVTGEPDAATQQKLKEQHGS